MQRDLFSDFELSRPPEPVLMSLKPEYYELIWQGRKRHEFRRRYLTGRRTAWYVYLTAPLSCLTAVIDLDEAITDTPQHIAEIAEQAQAGNGVSVYDYLRDLERGFALPITRVREYPGFTAAELTETLDSFHPPQGLHPDRLPPGLGRGLRETHCYRPRAADDRPPPGRGRLVPPTMGGS